MLGQPELIANAALVLIVTALFGRNAFKYGERGYRYAFLEAGHLAQNVNLVCAGLDLGCVNIGGFLDRQVDDFLDLDGTAHSALYMIAVGLPQGESAGGREAKSQ
jgi:SagB-type dehydrogenase family enzyme